MYVQAVLLVGIFILNNRFTEPSELFMSNQETRTECKNPSSLIMNI